MNYTPEPSKVTKEGGMIISEVDWKRAVECVNAMQGKTNPIQWMNEAHEILLKVFEFEHPEMKLGESKIDFMLRFIKQHTV
jgi:hypothetical protein